MSAPATLVFEKDVAIEMNDGNVLRANVFRPRAYGDAHSRYPVILAHGVYGKDIHFADGYKPQTREVEVTDGAPAKVEFVLQAAAK